MTAAKLLAAFAVPVWLTVPACAQGVRGLPAEVMAQVSDPAALPAGSYTPAGAWQDGGEGVGHGTGVRVEDPDAAEGLAWEVLPGRDRAGTMVFGPYIQVDPGDYLALFRLKLSDEQEEGLGDIDACVRYGQEVLAARELEIPQEMAGRYVLVPLGFRYDGGRLECRLSWPGFATLRFDGVSLYRLEGADLRDFGRVPPGRPRGEPSGLDIPDEPRPFPDVFPRSAPPADRVFSCDLSGEPPDRRLMMVTLQGLVNRERPEVYCSFGPMEQFWLDWDLKQGYIARAEPATADELLERFSDRVKGLVITDPRLPASKNVATMIASVHDGLVVSPRLSRQVDLPVLEDLRGRWQTGVEAYRWAFDTLWGRLNHHVIACSWPDHIALRDYLVQNRVFIFWLSGPLDGARKHASPDAEIHLMEELLAKMPVNMPVMSYPWAGKDIGIGEGPGVSLFAEFGKYLVGSIDCANLSVHSGIRVPELRQKPAPPCPELEDGKVYVAAIMSDGDNLPVLTNSNFPQLWAQEERGAIPIGWTLSPAASVLVPDVVEFYYSTATEQDHFSGAVSGVGYTYPDLYGARYRDGQQVYEGFLDQTADYMQRCDLDGLWVMNATRPEIIGAFAERIGFLTALFPDYGRRLIDANEATYPTARNVPVFHAVTGWREEDTRQERIDRLVEDIHSMTPAERPGFLHLFAINWFADLPMLQETFRRLGPDYVAVRPDHLAELYGRHLSREEVLLRFPATAAALEGRRLLVKGSVRNVGREAQELAVQLVDGLEQPGLSPGRLDLAVAQEAPVEVSGIVVADSVSIEVAGGARPKVARIAVRRIPASELAGTLPVPAEAMLSTARYLEAESLAHRSGAVVDDATAGGGRAWLAEAGDAEPGYIVFGPYQPLEPGRYLALFRLKRTGPGTGHTAQLDTCVAGGEPQTSRRAVSVTDLPEGRWRSFPLLMEHPGGNFETRVEWSGAANLAVDSVVVLRVEE